MDDESTRKVEEQLRDLPSDGTRRVEEDRAPDGTRRVFGGAPDVGVPQRLAPLGFLQSGHILLGRYEVIDTLHPHETERPGIFVCKDGDRRIVVKVAPVLYPPKQELWQKLPTLDHPNVLKVYETLERGGLFYEIQEYCEGGSLKEWLKNQLFPADWVMNHFVPQVNSGLKYLHEQGIVHRDVKPANIYLRQKHLKSSIVLGDFDISSVLASDRTSRDTGRNAGTWAYMPPEAYPRFIDAAGGSKAARVTRTSDYFSLGITMIELILGTTSLHSCDLPDLFDFYLSGGQIELPTKPAALVRLLRGLLIRDRHKRWSAEQVDRWLEQKNTYEDAQAILDDEYFSLRRAVTPYSIGYSHATDLVSLADMLLKYPDDALDDLLKSDRLINWVEGIDMNVARAIDRDRGTWRSEPEHCLFRTVMWLDRSRPFDVIGIGKARTKQEWLQRIIDSGKGIDQIAAGPASFPEVRKLDTWLHLKPDAEPEIGNRVGATLWQTSVVRLEEIAYIFDPTLPYSHDRNILDTLRLPEEQRTGGRTPAEIVEQAYGPAEGWRTGVPDCYMRAFDRWKGGFLAAWLRQHGLAALANSAQEASEVLKDHPFAAFEAFLRKLDTPKHVVQIHFEKMDYSSVLPVPYGQVKTLRIRYHTSGVGMPFASLSLEFAPEGVSISPLLIDQRSGIVTFSVDPSYRLQVSDVPHLATINISGGNCELVGDRPVVRYRVLPARETAFSHIAGGAMIGLLVLTSARLVIGAFVGTDPISSNIIIPDNFNQPERYLGYNGMFILALLFAGTIMYLGYRMWLAFLKRSQL